MSSTAQLFSPLASVVYLCVPAMKGKPVAEQSQLRATLETVVETACAPLKESDRLVLDAPEGMLIAILGSPHAALLAAQRALAASTSDTFGVSINHGPVTAINAGSNDARLIGDAIDAALSFGTQTPPGSLIISRAFRDAIDKNSPDDVHAFLPGGIYTDEQVRSHELFVHHPGEKQAAGRRLWLVTALACSAIIAGGFGGRSVLQSIAASRQPAVLIFDIKPYGDVYVDGAMKGRSPPLAQLALAPGAHRIEVRNGRQLPLVTEVELATGEQMQIRHSFSAPKPAKPQGLLDRLKFWQ
jgi:hypothetical protein